MTSLHSRNGGTIQLCPNILQNVQCMRIYTYTSLSIHQLYNVCEVIWSKLLYLDTIQPICFHS